VENSKRILVAEDQEDLLTLLEIFLKNLKFDVLTAPDGRAALQILKQKKVDLILSDVMMPMIDGYHLAQEVHETYPDTAPKIILMSSRDVAKERSIAMMAGADLFLQKPFSMESLRESIESLLK